MKRVGIDLGTTHIAVAFARGDEVELFPIDQLVSASHSDRLPVFASCLYAPYDGEVHERFAEAGWIGGAHARARAGEVAGRSIVSAKSWLGYGEVDRAAAILPWRLDDEDEVARISPVAAQRILLALVRRAWDTAHPRAPLDRQDVVLTVPASFDAVARELTVRAAKEAGLRPRLLEEPLAACYEWAASDDEVECAIPTGQHEGRVLVVDVGGGTTDLSLIRVVRERGAVSLERIAVGRHLLLGGDNMDLTLAHECERRFGGDRLAPRRFAELVQACRGAKERLFGEHAPESATVTLHGSGSRMLGGAPSTELRASEVHELIVDGFFPRIDAEAIPARTRTAIVAFGLPYERDVAITRHVAQFCARHGHPTALLLNGGVFRAGMLARRLHEVVQSWNVQPVTLLPAPGPEVAVAKGAVRYALGVAGRGRRITAGAARGYYVGIETRSASGQAVCVLPRGAGEGQPHRTARRFELMLGSEVRFELWAADQGDAAGQVVPIAEAFEPLAPLAAKLEGDGVARVELEAELTSVGTLELAGIAEDGTRHGLLFELRSTARRPTAPRHGKRLVEATGALEQIFGKGASGNVREVKGTFRELERICGKRDNWDVELCRGLFDALWSFHRGRRQSAEHEREFWHLAGFSLRPGSGAARDGERAAELFRLFEHRIAHGAELRAWQHFWIAWRRIASGLSEPAQARIRDVVDPYVAPAELKHKRDKSFKNDAIAEMLELAACLERVPSSRRGDLGSWIVERTWTDRDPRLWASLGRAGARIPAYASVHQVVSARLVERWLDHLLREKWQDVATAPRAAIAMCRLTGDRDRDVSDRTRAQVDKKLAAQGLGPEFRAPLHDVIALGSAEQSDFYGEDLPAGLRLSE